MMEYKYPNCLTEGKPLCDTVAEKNGFRKHFEWIIVKFNECQAVLVDECSLFPFFFSAPTLCDILMNCILYRVRILRFWGVGNRIHLQEQPQSNCLAIKPTIFRSSLLKRPTCMCRYIMNAINFGMSSIIFGPHMVFHGIKTGSGHDATSGVSWFKNEIQIDPVNVSKCLLGRWHFMDSINGFISHSLLTLWHLIFSVRKMCITPNRNIQKCWAAKSKIGTIEQ